MTHDEYIAALRSDTSRAGSRRAHDRDGDDGAVLSRLDGARAPGTPRRPPPLGARQPRPRARRGHASLRRVPSRAPDDGAAADWVEAGAAALADRLAEVEPDQRCWTWIAGPVHHRVLGAPHRQRDRGASLGHAERRRASPGRSSPRTPPTSIDEYFGVIARDRQRPAEGRRREHPLALHRHRGRVALAARRRTVCEFTREHAKGDVAMRGPASDLLLVTIGRAPGVDGRGARRRRPRRPLAAVGAVLSLGRLRARCAARR